MTDRTVRAARAKAIPGSASAGYSSIRPALVALISLVALSACSTGESGPDGAAPPAAPAGRVAPGTASPACPAPPGALPVLLADDDESVTRGLVESLLPFARLASTRTADVLKLARPSPAHEYLKALVGDWDAPSKFWIDEDARPIASPGSAVRRMILGGRYLYEDYEGHVLGRPFRGMGLNGYDNVKQAYVAMWVDTISTSIMTTTGTVDESGRTFTFNGEYRDPRAGVARRTRSTIRVLDSDRYVLEMYFVDDDDHAFKTLEIDYTRRK